MTLTFDLLTSKSTGVILDSMKFHDHTIGWITGSVMVRKPFSIINASWLWPFDPKIDRAHPWLMGSMCMNFHDYRLITETLIVWKPFTMNHAPWPMGCMCLKFHDYKLITESVIVQKPFTMNHAPWRLPLTFWPQTGGGGDILDSWGVSVWSFITISQKVSDLQPRNQMLRWTFLCLM